MLEALDSGMLRSRLGLEVDDVGLPAVGSVASSARQCVQLWRSPARARVTSYLHRQLIAAGFEESVVRERVADVVDALIDIGDVTAVRLDGKACLVSSRRTYVRIDDGKHAILGGAADSQFTASDHRRYARHDAIDLNDTVSLGFSDWLGPAGFRSHLSRRTAGQPEGTILEYWAVLSSVLRHDGSPLDRTQLRAVVTSPSDQATFFGRHNAPGVTGRWSVDVPDGIWCGVRPGRNPNEWHPVLALIEGTEAQALDLYDWDEWNWALLARGIAFGKPERSHWHKGVLSFEHPVPTQIVRALRLLGGPGERAWTWHVSEEANDCLDEWQRAEI